MAIDLGFDESGSDDTLLVTVQLAMVEQARKLKRKWKNVLRDARVPYFHAKEFNNYSHGVFVGLNLAGRIALLRELGKIARQHLSVGITGKVTKSLYEKKTSNEFRAKWGTAYTFAIQMLVTSSYIFAERMGLQADFNVLIEDGHRHASQAIQGLNDSKKAGLAFTIPTKLLNICLGSKIDHPILQASDMLAYSEWQRMNGGDMLIYDRFSASGGIYQPEFVDFDNDLVDIVVNGAQKWIAARKQWGQRKPYKKVDDNDQGI